MKIIKRIHALEVDIDSIPLDDVQTFEIFQSGATSGIFQFSSDGMKAHLKHLKPDKFDDLIAMNALYRPGPMEYIPNYIKRKHGMEEIEYDLPEMEEFLSGTYGITVYQEQVMLLSQKLAGFSKGDADMLRKGMGKKIKSVLDKLKPKFFLAVKKMVLILILLIKYGLIGKLLLLMHLISLTQLVMRLLLIKQHI